MNSTQLEALFNELTSEPNFAIEDSAYIYIDRIKLIYSDEDINNIEIKVNGQKIWDTTNIPIGVEKFVGQSVSISGNKIVVVICSNSFTIDQQGYYNYRKKGFLVAGEGNLKYQIYFSAVV